MQRRFYRQLWAIRFNKMLELEKQGVMDYQALFEECQKRYKGHAILAHLERLIQDEKRHTLLVEELLRILESQPDKSP